MSRVWTDVELCWLEALYSDTSNQELADLLDRAPRAIGLKARKLGLCKSEAFMARPENNGQFRAGQRPWNKGSHFDPGGRSHETRFQKGLKPHTWVPIGTEVTDSKDGYLKRKVRDDQVPTTYNWAFVHRLVWEEHFGPVPEGHVIVFRDGDRAHVAIDNLECVSRAELAQRNTMWNRYPREVAEVMHLRGQLRRRIREKEEQR